MTLFLLPLLLVAIYLAMYLMRTDKTPGCRWRAYRRDDDGVHWSCLVCGGKDPNRQAGAGILRPAARVRFSRVTVRLFRAEEFG
jgi:hypothetical protein